MRDLELTRRARKMRKEMTEPEMRLWFQLKAKRFDSVKFRRQKVIQNEQHRYIADFATNDPKLVIELDGDTHYEQQSYDAVRTQFMESRGYMILRFLNSDVMTNMEGVLTKIAMIIDELRCQPPLPTLSPEGERAKR